MCTMCTVYYVYIALCVVLLESAEKVASRSFPSFIMYIGGLGVGRYANVM